MLFLAAIYMRRKAADYSETGDASEDIKEHVILMTQSSESTKRLISVHHRMPVFLHTA